MNTLNEQQLDYLNYMLGSITSSGSMTHIHTRAHRPVLSQAHTLCHNACILSKLMTAGHMRCVMCLCARARVCHSRARASEQTPQSGSSVMQTGPIRNARLQQV